MGGCANGGRRMRCGGGHGAGAPAHWQDQRVVGVACNLARRRGTGAWGGVQCCGEVFGGRRAGERSRLCLSFEKQCKDAMYALAVRPINWGMRAAPRMPTLCLRRPTLQLQAACCSALRCAPVRRRTQAAGAHGQCTLVSQWRVGYHRIPDPWHRLGPTGRQYRTQSWSDRTPNNVQADTPLPPVWCRLCAYCCDCTAAVHLLLLLVACYSAQISPVRSKRLRAVGVPLCGLQWLSSCGL